MDAVERYELPDAITEAQVIAACAALGLDYTAGIASIKIGCTSVIVKTETSYLKAKHYGVERREYFYITASLDDDH